ncbi:MAG TPA: hypothetical protein VG722_08180 [Tepidisphaeraceae bacterium]|nr:hypothetical protein [Tepidisphaeraceae bacterium]
MKIFFDTNVYVAETLLGKGAQRIIQATIDASWRICASSYVAAETQRVIGESWDILGVWHFWPGCGFFAGRL